MGCPSFVIIGKNLTFSITTHDPDTGVLTDADSAPTYRIYEDETATAILNGSMAILDTSNTTGFYTELIACTVANGFEFGKSYTIYIEATVDSDKGGISYAFTAIAGGVISGSLAGSSSFTTTAQVIIDEAEAILQDTSNVRWTAAYHLAGVNDACKVICQFKPDAYIVSGSMVCVEGMIQTLPADGFKLQDVVCNMGTDGSTEGNSIQLIDRKKMDAMNPGWPSVTASATTEYFMSDERYPRQFLVYPKQPSSSQGYLQLLYSAAPAEIAAGATILIPDIYRPAILQYVLYYAYAKDLDVPGSAEKAKAYYSAFLNAIGVMQDVEKREDPRDN